MPSHLLNIEQLTLKDIQALLHSAHQYKHQNKPFQMGKNTSQTIALCFWENSTRTRVSFELAASRLGFKTLYLYAKQSSAEKGESDLDTLLTLYAAGIRCIVVRHFKDRYYQDLHHDLPHDCVLINAGDGQSGHPSQALLDLFTLQEHRTSLENLNVLFVGDVEHSRVVRSNVALLKQLNAQCTAFVPDFLQTENKMKDLDYCVDLDNAIEHADVVMMLRGQEERWNPALKNQHNASSQTYLDRYGLSEKRLDMVKPSAFILHPGPFRRGVEICEQALRDKRCLIWPQVHHGTFMRMAIFEFCMQGDL